MTRVVHRFAKNSREEVRVVRDTYRGREVADVRVWVRDEHGEPRPTPKGISLRVEQVPELLEAVEALAAACEVRR